MSIKQTIIRTFLGFLLAFAFAFTSVVAVSAADNTCGNVDTAIISCSQDNSGDVTTTGIWGVLLLTLNILTTLVAVAALAGLVWGAIQYTSAGGNVEQTKKAMATITNVVIGILAYGLMYAFLNFIIPGGVFN